MDPINFNKTLKDLMTFINDPLRPQAMLRQFCADLYNLIQHPKLLRTQKIVLKPIIGVINILTNIMSKHFYQNSDA